MKHSIARFSCLALIFVLLLGLCCVATAESTDAVSGAPLDNDIEIVYKEHFDDMVTRYADELTEAELLVSADVYDAIGMIRFDSEDSLCTCRLPAAWPCRIRCRTRPRWARRGRAFRPLRCP